MKKLFSIFTIALTLACSTFAGGDQGTIPTIIPATTLKSIPPGARIAVMGDSITEQKNYSRFIEAYLLACAGRKDIAVCNYGWGGERASGFADRAECELAFFKPTIVTLCYGMNDGGYRPYNDSIGRNYEQSMRAGLTKLKIIGVSHVLVGTPGAVDTKYFNPVNTKYLTGPWPEAGKTAAEGYNANLRALGDIGYTLAGECKQIYVDVHTPLINAMKTAKSVLGDDYDVCGMDGIHPRGNGGLVMAYAFIKGLGCDGAIGEITVDLKANTATSGNGHTITGCRNGVVKLESTRYPFCFDAETKSSASTRSILPYVPFNRELNRFILRATNIPAARMQVKWGALSKEFTREQLDEGINLAAEFEKTPFDEKFMQFLKLVAKKQFAEAEIVRGVIANLRMVDLPKDPETEKALDLIKSKLSEKRNKLEQELHDSLTAISHTISIIPVDK